MVTSKLVTNIYYGQADYLKESLNRLVNDGLIAWWVYCCHSGERQFNPIKSSWEGERLKDHIHVGIKPNKRLDLDTVYNETLQLDGFKKVIGFTRNWEFVRSQFDFWLYLYHDKDYLTSKNIVREYNYTTDDIIASDDDIKKYELYRAREAFWAEHGISHEVLQCVKGKISESQLIARHLRCAYGVDKLLKAARKEVINETAKDKNNYGETYLREIALGI